MSYQVFARKYRPRTFADVLGQDHVVQTLKNAIDQERIEAGVPLFAVEVVVEVVVEVANVRRRNRNQRRRGLVVFTGLVVGVSIVINQSVKMKFRNSAVPVLALPTVLRSHACR